MKEKGIENINENGVGNIRKKTRRKVQNRVPKTKSKIIKNLVDNKKKKLKIPEDTNSDNEHYETTITTLLEEEKNILFNAGVELNDSNTEDESRSEQNLPRVPFPIIPKHKIDRMFSLLQEKEKLNVYEKKVNDCLARIHTTVKPSWNSPSVILKALKDAVLRRKWENLPQLLLMLIHLPSLKYKPIIRHTCQILEKYHPVMRASGLQNQFNTITVASKGKNITLIE